MKLNLGRFSINSQRNNIILVLILTFSSALVYYIQYLLFHDTETTVFYMLQDLAFVPISVLLVSLIINRLLNIMETRKKLKKINVIISTFFIESGTQMLMEFSKFNRNHNISCSLIQIKELTLKKETEVKKIVKDCDFDIYAAPDKLENLAKLMADNKTFLLNMLENSNLLEHDSFTDMIWAVFHVGDELRSRDDLTKLSEADINHISNDILRAYNAMINEWVNYMKYLNNEYPFLYASAVQKNPFIVA